MPSYFNAPQGSDLWVEFRRNKRNASETPIIMGLTKYSSKKDVVDAKRGIEKKKNAAMFFGSMHERTAIDAFCSKFSKELEPLVVFEGEYSASLDGFDLSDNSILEVKCPFSGRKGDRWAMAEKGLPTEYDYIQVQHQLMVSGAEKAYLWIFDVSSGEGLNLIVLPDEKAWSEIKKAWNDFYLSLTQRDDKEWIYAANKYKNIKITIDTLSDQLEEARKYLLDLSGGNEASGCGLKISRVKGSKTTDWKSVKEKYLSDVDLSSFTKQAKDSFKITME